MNHSPLGQLFALAWLQSPQALRFPLYFLINFSATKTLVEGDLCHAADRGRVMWPLYIGAVLIGLQFINEVLEGIFIFAETLLSLSPHKKMPRILVWCKQWWGWPNWPMWWEQLFWPCIVCLHLLQNETACSAWLNTASSKSTMWSSLYITPLPIHNSQIGV